MNIKLMTNIMCVELFHLINIDKKMYALIKGDDKRMILAVS